MVNLAIVVTLLVGAFLVLKKLDKKGQQRKARPKPVADPLDTPLLHLTPNDPYTVRDLLNGGCLILGQTGSGKTSSSGKALGRAIVQHGNSGGLILCAKPEDAEMWWAIFEAAGRKDDLLEFAVDKDLRCNFIDYIRESGGSVRDITRCIQAIGETLRGGDSDGGEDGKYWEAQQERMIYNAVEIVRHATGKVDPWDLQRFINDMAQSPAMLKDDNWRKGFHCQCILRAGEKEMTPRERHDFDLAVEYWAGEMPALNDRTRSSITAGVNQILHVFNTGLVRELVATSTNVSPMDITERRKFLMVNAPPSVLGDQGSFINAGFKFITQRAVLKRKAKPGDPIVVAWCDEYHQLANSPDSNYLAQCRSHLGCMVVMTQSLSSMYAAMPGQKGHHQATALCANFGLKIFHSLGDEQTAHWGCALLGKQLQTFIGTSMQPVDNMFDEIFGMQKMSTSTSEHYSEVLQPRVLLNGLRTGGPGNNFICDAVLIKSGRPFSNGQNWLWREFSQLEG